MPFSVITFVDTFGLAGSLRSRMGLFPKAVPSIVRVHGPRRGTELEDEDFAFYADPVGKWPELKNMVGTLKRHGDRVLGGVALGCVNLELLTPGETLPWAIETGPYAERYMRAHLALRTNPGCRLYSGPDTLHAEIGWLNLVNVRVKHSAANFGEFARVHLVIDFRKKDQAE